MSVYLRAKFEVSSIILTGFGQWVILPPLLPPQNEPLRSPPRLGLSFKDGAGYFENILSLSFQQQNDAKN